MGDVHEEEKRGLRRPRSAPKVEGKAEWMNANPEILAKVISTAGNHKCAIRFGYSRDGGAYSVGVYTPNDYWTDFIRPSENIDDYLRDLLGSLEDFDASKVESAPRGAKKRV